GFGAPDRVLLNAPSTSTEYVVPVSSLEATLRIGVDLSLPSSKVCLLTRQVRSLRPAIITRWFLAPGSALFCCLTLTNVVRLNSLTWGRNSLACHLRQLCID